MKYKVFFMLLLILLCTPLLSVQAHALSDSDIRIQICAPIGSLDSESGVVAVEQFPATISIRVTARTGTINGIQLTYGDQRQDIAAEDKLVINGKEDCVPYTLTVETDHGAVLTITFNVVYQVKATYDIRYHTIAMDVREITEEGRSIAVFAEPRRIWLENANTLAEGEKERIAAMIGRWDGKTYTLKGSLIVQIHNAATGKSFSCYDTDKDFKALLEGYGWTSKTITAFETMRHVEISYQAPVKPDIKATWTDENKQKIYGRLSAQDKGVPELIYPYQTTSVTFDKEDIPLSRNFVYLGLEWDYTPETDKYTNGESKTQSSITQPINYKVPSADFFFKFKKQDADDLSVVIQAPATVYRGEPYSFTITFINTGSQPAYDVPLKGKVDQDILAPIPEVQDFLPNERKSYTIRRKADTPASIIHLWANIGVPEGFTDSNLTNNTATADIRVVVKTEPNPTETPVPRNPNTAVPPTDQPPVAPKICDLSVSIAAPPTVFSKERYSFTISFTNQSQKQLDSVSLLSTNNDTVLKQIPGAYSFKPQETKSFIISATAGSKGEIYNLWAYAGIPEGYRDENPLNNTAVTKITVIEKSPDDTDNPPDKPDNPTPTPSPSGNPTPTPTPIPGNNPTPSPTPNPSGNPSPTPSGNPTPNPPELPSKMQCDVWTNLSSPPMVYAQEGYTLTVYYANSTDKDLAGVRLQVTANGEPISGIPAMTDFKAFEKKSFVVTAIAPEKVSSIRVVAHISPPAEYTDINPANNEVTTVIMVQERPYDMEVQRITPDQYKEHQTVITTIKVANSGSQDFTPGMQVIVLLQIPELALTKRVDAVVMEQETWNVVAAKWDTPSVQADKSITLIATINPYHDQGNESSYGNNTFSQKAVILNTDYGQPQESRTVPTPPQRTERPKVTWWEQRYEGGQFVWKQFYAELKVIAALDYDTKSKGYLKSGYGYSISVTAAIDTNYDKPELITRAQTAEVYLPQYSYKMPVSLVSDRTNHFTFRENLNSPFKYKKEYVPVWFPDNKDFVIQLLVTDVHTPGGTLSKWITGGELKIYIKDSMYSDDITTGS